MKLLSIIIAIVVLIAIIIAGYLWWTKDTVRFNITGIAPTSGPAGSTALTLTGTTTSPLIPSSWVGRPIRIYTKALGTLKTAVASAGTGTLTTAPIAFTAAYTYAAAPSDYARIFMKLY
jgi:hypothetical protein